MEDLFRIVRMRKVRFLMRREDPVCRASLSDSTGQPCLSDSCRVRAYLASYTREGKMDQRGHGGSGCCWTGRGGGGVYSESYTRDLTREA